MRKSGIGAFERQIVEQFLSLTSTANNTDKDILKENRGNMQSTEMHIVMKKNKREH